MRIGQKADVKNQVGIIRHTMLESEADAGDQNVPALFLFLKEFDDVMKMMRGNGAF